MIDRSIKKRGRPLKRVGERLEGISLSLPASDVARLHAEAEASGAGSVSAVVRVAVSDYLRRLDKRRTRDD